MPVSPAVRHFFQIGDVPIHAHVNEISPVEVKATGKSLSLQDSYRRLMVHAPRKIESRTERADLLIFNNGRWSEGQLAQRLLNLINSHTDVIAYETVSTNAEHGANCSCASCCCSPCHLLWLHNSARITDVKITGGDADRFSAQVSFEYSNYWKAINRYLWQVTGDYATSLSKYAISSPVDRSKELLRIPSCNDVFNGRCQAFFKRNHTDFDWLYEPKNFILMHNYGQHGYPKTGFATWWENYSEHFIMPHAFRWSAPPMSIYVARRFKDRTDTATIEIKYRNINDIEERNVSIDFEAINDSADDAGVTIFGADRLVFGDIEGHAAIYRKGVPVHYVADALTWDGDWPGQLNPGPNIIRLNTGGDALIAQHHYYRRL